MFLYLKLEMVSAPAAPRSLLSSKTKASLLLDPFSVPRPVCELMMPPSKPGMSTSVRWGVLGLSGVGSLLSSG